MIDLPEDDNDDEIPLNVAVEDSIYLESLYKSLLPVCFLFQHFVVHCSLYRTLCLHSFDSTTKVMRRVGKTLTRMPRPRVSTLEKTRSYLDHLQPQIYQALW